MSCTQFMPRCLKLYLNFSNCDRPKQTSAHAIYVNIIDEHFVIQLLDNTIKTFICFSSAAYSLLVIVCCLSMKIAKVRPEESIRKQKSATGRSHLTDPHPSSGRLAEWHWPMTPTSLHCHILQAVKSMSEKGEVGAESEWNGREEEGEEGCYAECPWRKDQRAKIWKWIEGLIPVLVSSSS